MLIEKFGKSNSRLEFVSNVKAVAILMVVFLHSASPLFYQLGKIGINRWYITVFYDSFVRSCVPLFLMVSGATVLNKDYKSKDWFINKIFKRLFLPFIFYFFIVIIVNKGSVFSFFNLGKIAYWFPFFGIILTLYLLYPIIRTWLKYTNMFFIYYFILIWFISIIFNFFVQNFTLFTTNAIYGYIGFPILGYLILKINTKKIKYLGLLTYILFGLLVFFLTVSICLKQNIPNERYFGYLSPFVVLMSIGLFLYIKNINFVFKNKIIIFIRDFLSDHSYGICFLHPLIISRFYYLHNIINPIFSDWMIFGAGIIITSLIVYFLNKIPIIKNFVG